MFLAISAAQMADNIYVKLQNFFLSACFHRPSRPEAGQELLGINK